MTLVEVMDKLSHGKRIINTNDGTVLKYEDGKLLRLEVNSHGKESYRECKSASVGDVWVVEGAKELQQLDDFAEAYKALEFSNVFSRLERTIIREALSCARRRLKYEEE